MRFRYVPRPRAGRRRHQRAVAAGACRARPRRRPRRRASGRSRLRFGQRIAQHGHGEADARRQAPREANDGRPELPRDPHGRPGDQQLQGAVHAADVPVGRRPGDPLRERPRRAAALLPGPRRLPHRRLSAFERRLLQPSRLFRPAREGEHPARLARPRGLPHCAHRQVPEPLLRHGGAAAGAGLGARGSRRRTASSTTTTRSPTTGSSASTARRYTTTRATSSASRPPGSSPRTPTAPGRSSSGSPTTRLTASRTRARPAATTTRDRRRAATLGG